MTIDLTTAADLPPAPDLWGRKALAWRLDELTAAGPADYAAVRQVAAYLESRGHPARARLVELTGEVARLARLTVGRADGSDVGGRRPVDRLAGLPVDVAVAAGYAAFWVTPPGPRPVVRAAWGWSLATGAWRARGKRLGNATRNGVYWGNALSALEGRPAGRPTAVDAAIGVGQALFAQGIFGVQFMHRCRPTCNQLVVAAEISAGRW